MCDIFYAHPLALGFSFNPTSRARCPVEHQTKMLSLPMEEEVGFEPTEGCPSPPFQDGAIGLSAILPFLSFSGNPRLFTTIRALSLSIITNSKWIALKNKPVHLSFPNPLPVAVFPFMSALGTF